MNEWCITLAQGIRKETPGEWVGFMLQSGAVIVLLYAWFHDWIRAGSFKRMKGPRRDVTGLTASLWSLAALGVLALTVMAVLMGAVVGERLTGKPALSPPDAGAPDFVTNSYVQAGTYLFAVPMCLLFAWWVAAWAEKGVVQTGEVTGGATGNGSRDFLRWRVSELFAGLGLSPLLLSVCGLLGVGISGLVRVITGTAPDAAAHATLAVFREHSADWRIWLIMSAATIGAPIVEEHLYRGMMQSAFLRATRSAWISIVATACVFAVMHVNVTALHALPILLVVGIALGIVMERRRNVWACVGMHMGFNAGQFLLMAIVMGDVKG